ncbi:MAG TPA: N-acetyltransferase [Terriglobia bacterium]|nr:N-acetyltransferase [Terriglobia bacterium]
MIVRAAHPDDISTMIRIISHHAAQGLMLPRSAGALAATLGTYVVADSDGEIVGCGGLHQYTTDTAELIALATAPGGAPDGTGRALVDALVNRAKLESVTRVFALTLAPGFFSRMGFRTVEHSTLPLKVWTDCVACPKYGNCDEIAMVLDFDREAA